MNSDDALKKRIQNFIDVIDDNFLIRKKKSKLRYKIKEMHEIENEQKIYALLEIPKSNQVRKSKIISKCMYTNYIRYESEKYIISVSLPTQGEFDLKTEHDSVPEVWDFYDTRYCGKIDSQNKVFKYKSISFLAHGDVDFNLGFTKASDLLGELDVMTGLKVDEKELLENLINDCARLNYSLINYSVLPTIGNLQGAKEKLGNDRLDTFIWALSMYYDGKEALILNNSSCSSNNMFELKRILDEFGSLEEFCWQVYGISGDIINKHIDSGSKALNTYDNMIQFFESVIQYWIIRFNDFDHNNCRTKYYKMGGENIRSYFIDYHDKLSINFNT